MRVLIAHCMYSSGPASGENLVAAQEASLLSEQGHEVIEFFPSARSERMGLVRNALDAVWAREAVGEIRQLIRKHGIELAHFHNLFPALSPVALSAARDARAATVMTLHNFRLMCLPATFVRDGEICEDCLGRFPWPGIVHGCYRSSRLGSGVLATSLGVHRRLKTFGQVNRFIAVSSFVRDKYDVAGFPRERIAVKPHFASRATRRTGAGEHFLFAGRLSSEKGLDVLIRAWSSDLPPLVVAGSGPDEEALRSAAPEGVRFLGTVPPDRVRALLSNTRALLVPSRGFEAFGKAVVEAYAQGVPVVASAMGGLPEIVDHEVTGLLVPPGDPSVWREALLRLSGDDAFVDRLSNAAYAMWQERYTPETNLEQLLAIYREAVADARP